MADSHHSPVHEIVRSLWNALRALGVNAPAAEVEGWALSIHCALSSTARQFHSHEHVIELATGASPLETIAALYHDVVYVQVDGRLPASMDHLLSPLLAPVEGGWRIRSAAAASAPTRAVLAVFGHVPGDVLGPMSGLNELASALAFAEHLGRALDEDAVIAIAACIEATIPFREGPGGELAARLLAMGVPSARVTEHVERAMRVANRDVANFADEDPSEFLANTWKLLPETNPSLNVPARYTVSDYRIALMKMETFLERLPPERVFHTFGAEPSPEEHARRVHNTRRNMAMAVRYLRVKLYAIALIESICLATGGDLPLQYVMGALSSRGRKARLESFLPPATVEIAPDPELATLLRDGRAGEASFDIAPSPLAAHLLAVLGEVRIAEGVAAARLLWAGTIDALAFVDAQRPDVMASLARAASSMAVTRREVLLALAERLSPKSEVKVPKPPGPVGLPTGHGTKKDDEPIVMESSGVRYLGPEHRALAARARARLA